MSKRKEPRSPRPDEVELWNRVARTARPLRGRQAESPIFGDAQPEFDTNPKTKPPSKPRQIRSAQSSHSKVSEQDRDTSRNLPKTVYRKLVRGKSRPEARLDLHGMTADAARTALIGFLFEAQASGKRLVLVITGKGRASDDWDPVPQRAGVLRQSLPVWTDSPPLRGVVQDVVEAHQRHGGGGAFYVYLRRLR